MDDEQFTESVMGLVLDGEKEESEVSHGEMAKALAIGIFALYSDDGGSEYRVDEELL